tara:strand:+ start:849 stop:1094 length:246 start_codon:yes stop_codon:yes gene_type:complete
MPYRTEQDKINRKEANQRYYELEENKQQKRDYMKEYAKRDYVKERAHKKYIQKKIEDAQLDISNDNLNIENTERFIDGAQG